MKPSAAGTQRSNVVCPRYLFESRLRIWRVRHRIGQSEREHVAGRLDNVVVPLATLRTGPFFYSKLGATFRRRLFDNYATR